MKNQWMQHRWDRHSLRLPVGDRTSIRLDPKKVMMISTLNATDGNVLVYVDGRDEPISVLGPIEEVCIKLDEAWRKSAKRVVTKNGTAIYQEVPL